jgi:hypothetical protein
MTSLGLPLASWASTVINGTKASMSFVFDLLCPLFFSLHPLEFRLDSQLSFSRYGLLVPINYHRRSFPKLFVPSVAVRPLSPIFPNLLYTAVVHLRHHVGR